MYRFHMGVKGLKLSPHTYIAGTTNCTTSLPLKHFKSLDTKLSASPASATVIIMAANTF